MHHIINNKWRMSGKIKESSNPVCKLDHSKTASKEVSLGRFQKWRRASDLDEDESVFRDSLHAINNVLVFDKNSPSRVSVADGALPPAPLAAPLPPEPLSLPLFLSIPVPAHAIPHPPHTQRALLNH